MQNISFGGVGSISADANQDRVDVIRVETSNLVTLELRKPLGNGDSAGNDIEWAVCDTNTLIIILDSNGAGSSRGSSGHTSVLAVTEPSSSTPTSLNFQAQH